MQLQRSSDLEGSDPIQFTYQPEDPGISFIRQLSRFEKLFRVFIDSGNKILTLEHLKMLVLPQEYLASRVNFYQNVSRE